MRRKIILIILVTVVLFGYFHEFGLAPPIHVCMNFIHPSLLKDMWTENKKINFYGKVIDQASAPVKGADIYFNISYSGRMIDEVIKTDDNGLFKVLNERGRNLYIDKIEKQGYEFDSNRVAISYDYGGEREERLHKPDKNNPVIFYMRKKEPPTLVIPCSFGWINKTVKEEEMDLTRCEQYTGKIQENYGRLSHADLKARMEMSKGDTHYKLIIVTPDDGSGIIASDVLSYVPPESGYQPRLELIVPLSGELKKYLYVKSRAGKVYARLDTTIRVGEKDISIGMKAWTNPTGQRNVDYYPDLYMEHLTQKNDQEKRKSIELAEKVKKEERKNRSLWWRIFH